METIMDYLIWIGIALKSVLNYFTDDKISNLAKKIIEIVIFSVIITIVLIYSQPNSIVKVLEGIKISFYIFGSIYGVGYAGSKVIEKVSNKNE